MRAYNSLLGRFNNPDPMGQFHSPYLGMGNSPVNGTDPSGGYFYFPGTYGDLRKTQALLDWRDRTLAQGRNWSYGNWYASPHDLPQFIDAADDPSVQADFSGVAAFMDGLPISNNTLEILKKSGAELGVEIPGMIGAMDPHGNWISNAASLLKYSGSFEFKTADIQQVVMRDRKTGEILEKGEAKIIAINSYKVSGKDLIKTRIYDWKPPGYDEYYSGRGNHGSSPSGSGNDLSFGAYLVGTMVSGAASSTASDLNNARYAVKGQNLAKQAVRIMKIGKVLGTGTGVLGLGITGVNAWEGAYSSNQGAYKPLEGMGEFVGGALGFIPGVGWALSGSYFFIQKPLMDNYVNKISTNPTFLDTEFNKAISNDPRFFGPK